MEALATLFASINYRDPVWIAVAYLFGFIVWQIGLPPLVGFLVAGFTLNILGATGGEFLNEMADMGVTLLLFTIGLKLQVRQLLRPEVWAVATTHMVTSSCVIAGLLILLSPFGLPLLSELDTTSAFILAFALSFSSTVFAVKVFEEKGGMGSQYGRIAIGVLIVQDIAAVIFLAASTAKLPSPWAGAVIIALIFAKPLLIWLLKRAGHGELLILYGLVLALGGSTLFELVSLKGDLGALFFGVLVANHPKAGELAKSLLSLKDLFLVGFFLSIGIAVTPSTETVFMAIFLMLLIPFKMTLFHVLFTKFRLRTRNAAFASLSLSNYSEFGLIVAAIAYSNQWISQEWLAVMSLSVVFSFILASPLNAYNSALCERFCPRLRLHENCNRLPEDEHLELGAPKVLVSGMGRIGGGAIKHLESSYKKGEIVGIDYDLKKVEDYHQAGYQVVYGDASNPDFWERVKNSPQQLEMIMLCMPNHEAVLQSAKTIRKWGFTGHLAAVAKYEDEEIELQEAGVDSTFNIFAEVGSGFAQDVLTNLKPAKSS